MEELPIVLEILRKDARALLGGTRYNLPNGDALISSPREPITEAQIKELYRPGSKSLASVR